MSEELKCSFYANGERAVDQKMALELFKAKALIGGLRKELAELRKAVDNYAGPFDDPAIGWRGSSPSRIDFFKCERCGAEHMDSSKIEHKQGCAAKALAALLPEVK